MDTQTQIERLIELAIIQRSELKRLVDELPQLREHLSSEIEKTFEDAEPQLRAELEEFIEKRATDATAKTGAALEAKIKELSSNLEISTQARFNAIIAEREENARLAAQAEAKIAEHAASLPSAVKDIVTAELARFPRAGEIDQLRKEFAEPRGLNPRGKWQAGETYNKLDLVTINGDSYTSNTDGNRTRPSRSSADWTLVAARGTGGGGGPTSLSELTTVPSDGDLLIGSGTSWVTSNLTAGAGISITVGPGAITISATDGDITLDDGTAASPSLHFTNDPDTGLYRPAANTLGISVSGTQVAYFDENGLTVPSAGVVAGGSIHAGNGNANNPSLSFDGDQDTGFFRHQANEIGIALGGTQYATLTSTTFSITPVVTMASSLRVNGTTDSSSKDTGAIVTEGGLGVEKSATFGGNLTVSGTAITLSNTNSISLNLRGGAPGSSSAGIVLGTNASDIWTIGRGVVSGGNTMEFYASTGTPGTRFSIVDTTGNATLSGNLTVSGTGNSSVAGTLLVATTTNSSNGKIQLADHTTSAGGIGFGTDLSLYRANTGFLILNDASAALDARIGLYNNGTQRGLFEAYNVGTAVYIGAASASWSTIITSGNQATALTLDSSQRTFTASAAKIGSLTGTVDSRLHVYESTAVSTSNGLTLEQASTGDSLISFLLTGVQRWSVGIDNSDSDKFKIGTGDLGAADKFTVDTSGNATVAGAIAIGNTVQTAVGVASTHKVTISIGGSTYYLLATNV